MRYFFFLLLLFIGLGAQAQRAYVDADATGNNDGTSWANAFTDLQLALRDTIQYKEIWVAEGIYQPDTASRDSSFFVYDSLSLIGGFAGTETHPDQRDISAHPTILDGDLGQPNDSSDNTYNLIRKGINSNHRVKGLLFDGLIIQNAFAQYLSGSSENSGGGIYLDNESTITILNCKFFNNKTEGSGAAIKLRGNYNPNGYLKIHNCEFIENRIINRPNNGNEGGGIHLQGGVLEVDSSLFYSNWAERGGAIMFNGLVMEVKNSIFIENQGWDNGGAIDALSETSSLTSIISNCTFHENTSDWRGGALFINWRVGGEFQVYNNVFYKNSVAQSSGSGGAVSINNGTIADPKNGSIINCLFLSNDCENGGGASARSVDFVNCTFYKNIGHRYSPGAIKGSGRIINCVIWDNGPDEIGNFNPDNIYNSIIQDFSGGIANFNLYPDFIDTLGNDGIAGTLDDDVRLDSFSKGIDAGFIFGGNSLPTDLAGGPRILNERIDIGAYESGYDFAHSLVRGKVYTNFPFSACVVDSNSKGLNNQIILSKPGNIFSYSDYQGEYIVPVYDTGSHEIAVVQNSINKKLFNPVCPIDEVHTVSLDSIGIDTTGLDFAYEGDSCILPSVNVASNRRRYCFTNTTIVEYCNKGVIPIYNGALIKVKLPAYVVALSASIPYTFDADSNLVFYVDSINGLDCGTITITDSVRCGNINILGLTQCTRAWINVPNTCNTPDSNWSEANLEIEASCFYYSPTLNAVRPVITNTGSGDMNDSVELRVFYDSLLVAVTKIKLASGDSITFQIPANGHTVRVEVDQPSYHPTETQISIAIEECGSEQGFVVSKNFVDQFSQDDEPSDISIDCLPILASYDPNDKRVSPRGTTQDHHIKPGTKLDYKVRFQNTGTDTAFTVTVIDTLSPYLDISTLQLGASSHAYDFSVSGIGVPVLQFTFNNILLPDSNTNLLASQGFFTYSIYPFDTLTIGTLIENFVDIYFDYNLPVRTNTTHSMIWEGYDTAFVQGIIETCDNQINLIANTEGATYSCSDNTGLLSATPQSSSFVQWRKLSGSGTVVSPNQATTLVTNISSDTSIFEWAVLGCDTVLKDTLILSSNIVPAKPYILSKGKLQVCNGDSIVVYAIDEYPGYLWSTGATSDSVVVFNTTNIYLIVVDTNGCHSPPSDPISVTVYDYPAKPVVNANNDVLSSSVAGTFYEWYLNDTLLADTTQSIMATVEGNYQVVAYNEMCESEISDKYLYETVGIHTIPTSQWNIYPNPNSGEFMLSFNQPMQAGSQVYIYDIIGNLILQQPVTGQVENITIPLPGVYMVQFISGEQVAQRKVVVY